MKIKPAIARRNAESISLLSYLARKQLTPDLPKIDISEGRFNIRLAQTQSEVDAALRLRYQVFNVELGNEDEASFGFDEDEFDATSHHLIATSKETDEVVGVYRLRTLELARQTNGFYSDQEFKLKNLPEDVLAQSVEIGRACIARQYRHKAVLFLLWKGLANYIVQMRKRYLFGCCSLFTQDYAVGKKAWQKILRDGHFHESFRVEPQENYTFTPQEKDVPDLDEEIRLPKLFRSYLRIGAKVCSEPVIDRQFKTTDFFVIFDVAKLEDRYRRMFFGDIEF